MRKRPKQSLINPKVRRAQQSRRIKLVVLIILAIALSQLIAHHQRILAIFGDYLIYQQEPQGVDVIVVANNWEDTVLRTRGAADLYTKGMAKKIFIPRMERMRGAEEIKQLGINVPENRDVVTNILLGLGVPSDAIETSSEEVSDTWDEAAETKKFIEQKKYASVLLVTSKYHSRRAFLIFKDALKGKATVISTPSPYDEVYAESWWKHRDDAKAVFMEYLKLLIYCWRKVF
jgi:uncharacterized SAM-binding protein YcdF (DUF218 family)